MTGSTLNIVAVSGDTHREALLGALMSDRHDFGMVFVEPIAGGYTRIKQIDPDMIILYCDIDDADACQLLSMLALDTDLSMVPVVTCLTERQLN